MADAAAQPGPARGARDRPMTVSDVVRAATAALDGHVGTVWLEGETDSVKRAASGHIYLCLKDRRATISAVMWRSDASRLRFQMVNGLHLRCRGRLGIYERDGRFQLYLQHAEPAGLGADALALEQLKKKLAAEGLFDPRRKRPLPHLPRRIGIVTSRTGAAVRDIIQAVHRRFPVPILLAPTQVQGAGAPARIVRAITAICRSDVDVVIIGRGGGSAVDLSAYNDERVVRAVAACPVPIISAVGHEVDISLADLAADVRAATPTMAGEMAVPVRAEAHAALVKEEGRLRRELTLRLRGARQDIDQSWAAGHHALTRALAARRRRLDGLLVRLRQRHPEAVLVGHRSTLQQLEASMSARARGQIDAARHALARLEARLHACGRNRLDRARRELATACGRLEAMSPLRVLERGYAIASADAHVLTRAADVSAGERVAVRLRQGRLDCLVEAVHDEPEQP